MARAGTGRCDPESRVASCMTALVDLGDVSNDRDTVHQRRSKPKGLMLAIGWNALSVCSNPPRQALTIDI